ncbi:hypothetical protein G9A89_001064 [Geosiphon pyriformis]|nr:hypothetical protein G9A89_001064 [Geosiphon pyriformis]
MAAAKLANDYGIVVNTNLKCPINNCTNQAIVLKEILVKISVKTVYAAVAEFGIIRSIKIQLDQADRLAAKWSILIGKNTVQMTRTDVNKQTWDSKDEFRALLYTLFMSTTAHDIWEFIDSISGKTCIIDYNLLTYAHICCAIVCFGSKSDLNRALNMTPIIKRVGLYWSHLSLVLCSVCKTLGYTFLFCKVLGDLLAPKSKKASLSVHDQFRLAKIYEKKSVPISYPLFFSDKTWALVVKTFSTNTFYGGKPFFGSINDDKFLSPVVNKLKFSLTNLVEQIGELAKRLDSLMPTNLEGDIMMKVGLGKTTSGETAIVSNPSSFFYVKIVMCNIKGMNNPAKQEDIVYWHKDINNLIVNKFSGLNSGYLGSGVAVVIDNFLIKHMYKIYEISSQLLSIKLLFKNRLFVSILGLYVSASSAVQFSQASNINSLIAKAINESFFVIFGSNFNEDGFHKCASFKKCFSLGLVNSLVESSTAKMLTWENSRNIAKTIDYIFVSSNLVNAILCCNVLGVGKHFDTDHHVVSMSMGLSRLLDVQLNSFCKQANRNCWKFDIKNTNKNTVRKVVSLLANVLVSRLAKAFHEVVSDRFVLVNSGANSDYIHSSLFGVRKSYCVSKLAESLHAEKLNIRFAIEK